MIFDLIWVINNFLDVSLFNFAQLALKLWLFDMDFLKALIHFRSGDFIPSKVKIFGGCCSILGACHCWLLSSRGSIITLFSIHKTTPRRFFILKGKGSRIKVIGSGCGCGIGVVHPFSQLGRSLLLPGGLGHLISGFEQITLERDGVGAHNTLSLLFTRDVYRDLGGQGGWW